eukprot:m.22457 g.22457  ORF g.22457 m.22457 type:complete len:378 (+) comp8302_c0_seq1:128-1261(+)
MARRSVFDRIGRVASFPDEAPVRPEKRPANREALQARLTPEVPVGSARTGSRGPIHIDDTPIDEELVQKRAARFQAIPTASQTPEFMNVVTHIETSSLRRRMASEEKRVRPTQPASRPAPPKTDLKRRASASPARNARSPPHPRIAAAAAPVPSAAPFISKPARPPSHVSDLSSPSPASPPPHAPIVSVAAPNKRDIISAFKPDRTDALRVIAVPVSPPTDEGSRSPHLARPAAISHSTARIEFTVDPVTPPPTPPTAVSPPTPCVEDEPAPAGPVVSAEIAVATAAMLAAYRPPSVFHGIPLCMHRLSPAVARVLQAAGVQPAPSPLAGLVSTHNLDPPLPTRATTGLPHASPLVTRAAALFFAHQALAEAVSISL